MNYRIVTLIFASATVLTSCFLFGDDKERFIETYRETLIIREMYPDTARANREIEKLFERTGYDKASFKEDYNYYESRPEEFLEIMDSARDRNQRELMKVKSRQ